MTHLSDEQLEDVLAGRAAEPEHLAGCDHCSSRLTEGRALRAKLQSAFVGVHAGEALAERIRGELRRDEVRLALTTAPKARSLRALRWLAPLAAAAALLIAIPAVIFFAGSEPAEAASAELFRIHQHGLSPHTELYSDADPESLAGFLKKELGFKPAFPRLDAGMSLRGCCIAHFRDKPVGSYVVDTPRGVISIIVVTETPDALGMKDAMRRGDDTYMAGSFAKCNMVTWPLDGYTYCAVGEVSREYLADLLEQLVK